MDKNFSTRIIFCLVFIVVLVFFLPTNKLFPKADDLISIQAHLIEINGIYTISVIAQNNSSQEVAMMLPEGVQADYLLEERASKRFEKWSDNGNVYSFSRKMSIAPGASRVVSNFPKILRMEKNIIFQDRCMLSKIVVRLVY